MAGGLPLTFGTVVILTGLVVLLLWIPLRQTPGLGTVANVVVIGVASDVTLRAPEQPDELVGALAAPGRRASSSTVWPAPSTSARSSAPDRATG